MLTGINKVHNFQEEAFILSTCLTKDYASLNESFVGKDRIGKMIDSLYLEIKPFAMSETRLDPSSSRRNFLKTTGSLIIGFPLLGACVPEASSAEILDELPGSLRRFPKLDSWLEVLEDGRVRVFSGKVELGQGIRIAIKQVAAEELYMDLEQVEVHLAETGRTPNEGYTAGSGSIQNSAIAVRHAAAYARERLLQMAASKWQLPQHELRLSKGKIHGPDNSEPMSFAGVLGGKQLEEEVKLPISLKPKADYQYVGKEIRRDDLEPIIRGEGQYVQDLRFPGMLYAQVLRPKNYQSKLLSFDQEGFEKAAMGVHKAVVNGSFIGIISNSTYEAEKAIRLLNEYTKWTHPEIFPVQKDLREHLKEIADAPKIVHEKGEIGSISDKNSLKASYFKPYIMHASLGPAASVAFYDKKILHVWTHSQGIYPLREALAGMLQMPVENLHLISVPGPGCFGHTVSDDAAADAALLAMAYPGKHIMVQWSREDEHAWEPYGSAMEIELEAGLDSSGKISFYRSDIWTDSHSTRPNKDVGTVLPARHLETPIPMKGRGYLNGGYRNGDPYYDIPHQQINAHFFDGPLRVSSLRSLAAFGNIFAMESFMDELAEKAGEDSLEFRLKHVTDPRAKAVLEEVGKMTKGEKLNPEEGIGFAFCRYKNRAAYCAMAAKVSTASGKIRLLKMWAAVDVGEIINPDGLRSQSEGGMLQAASWALKESVSFSKDRITSRSWGAYPILLPGEYPDLEVSLIDRPNEPAMGGGEASVPPVGAAIANAVFRASGQRLYEMPLKLE